MADEIVKWARTARPLALALVALASLAAGLYLAALLSVLVAVVRPATSMLTLTELWLVGGAAVAASASLAIALGRAFRRRWPSTPAVRQLDQLVGATLLSGVLALGTLELVGRGVTFARPPLVSSPRLVAGGLVLAAAIAAIELWRRRRD